MKVFLPALLLLFLASACSSPPPPNSSRPPVDETSCRAAIREALVYKSTTKETIQLFEQMSRSADGKHMDSYYSTLGVNISSIAFLLDRKTEEKISLDLRDIQADEMARWLTTRLPNGKSLVDLEDVDGLFFDGDFMRVDLQKKCPVNGYFYIHCGVIEGRDISEKVYVDYFQPGADAPRKLSLAALLRLM